MSVMVCDVCPARFGDPQVRGEKPSSERLWDHMLDEHRDYVLNGKANGLPPDAWHESDNSGSDS
jgi:hypothetical protein